MQSKNKPAMTRDERFPALVRMGCVVCRLYLGVRSEPCIHHLSGLKYRGVGMKAKDEHTIPLCPSHHDGVDKLYPSVHRNPLLFKDKYGSQEELLNRTNELLDKMP